MTEFATDTNYSGLTGDQAVWNGTPTKVEPGAGEKASGFVPGVPAVAQHVNWLITQGADVQVFATDGTWTAPASGTMVDILLVGGGGGGGSSDTANGGGGGGAGFRQKTSVPKALLASTGAIVIGAGGASDTDGAHTSFTSGTYIAMAYGGGGAITNSGGLGYAAGGKGGESGSGDPSVAGGNGYDAGVGYLDEDSDAGQGYAAGCAGGAAGTTSNGGGGGGGGGALPAASTLAVAGTAGDGGGGGGPGLGYGGGGGGGGRNSGAARPGGAGGIGYAVIVTY